MCNTLVPNRSSTLFGLGVLEMIVLAMMAIVPVVVVVVVLSLSKRGGGRVAELEDENQRLRDELDRRDER